MPDRGVAASHNRCDHAVPRWDGCIVRDTVFGLSVLVLTGAEEHSWGGKNHHNRRPSDTARRRGVARIDLSEVRLGGGLPDSLRCPHFRDGGGDVGGPGGVGRVRCVARVPRVGLFGVRPRLARLSGRLATQSVGLWALAVPNLSCFSSFGICRGCSERYSVVVAEPGSPPSLNLSAFGGPALQLPARCVQYTRVRGKCVLRASPAGFLESSHISGTILLGLPTCPSRFVLIVPNR